MEFFKFSTRPSRRTSCIGVDPYYLTYKAQEVGYEPEIILAGRKLNDSMAGNVANDF